MLNRLKMWADANPAGAITLLAVILVYLSFSFWVATLITAAALVLYVAAWFKYGGIS